MNFLFYFVSLHSHKACQLRGVMVLLLQFCLELRLVHLRSIVTCQPTLTFDNRCTTIDFSSFFGVSFFVQKVNRSMVFGVWPSQSVFDVGGTGGIFFSLLLFVHLFVCHKCTCAGSNVTMNVVEIGRIQYEKQSALPLMNRTRCRGNTDRQVDLFVHVKQ